MAINAVAFPRSQKPFVRVHNDFANAHLEFDNATAYRVLFNLISCIRDDDIPSINYKITIDSILKYEGDHNYSRVKAAIKILLSSTVLFEKDRFTGEGYPIFHSIKYDIHSLSAQFHEEVFPFLSNLKSYYTVFKLDEYCHLNSHYSRVLFPALCACAKKSLPTKISLDELHLRLSTPPSLRGKFNNFKNRVLVPSHDEINSKTSLQYDWEPIKEGNKTVAINFVFQNEDKLPLPDCKNLNNKSLEILLSLGINKKSSEYLLNLCSAANKDINSYINILKERYSKKENADSDKLPAYIYKSLENECKSVIGSVKAKEIKTKLIPAKSLPEVNISDKGIQFIVDDQRRNKVVHMGELFNNLNSIKPSDS